MRQMVKRIKRWRRDRCTHCGHRFRWSKDARHSFGNEDRRVYHDPCMGYVTWRAAAEERLEILGIVCQVWGVNDRDVKGVVEMRTPDNAEGAKLRDRAFRVFNDLSHTHWEAS